MLQRRRACQESAEMWAYKHRMEVVGFHTGEGARIGGQSHAKALDTGLKFIRLNVSEIGAGDAFGSLSSRRGREVKSFPRSGLTNEPIKHV